MVSLSPRAGSLSRGPQGREDGPEFPSRVQAEGSTARSSVQNRERKQFGTDTARESLAPPPRLLLSPHMPDSVPGSRNTVEKRWMKLLYLGC